MAFLSKSVSHSLYQFELLYHGPFLLGALWGIGFLTGSFLSWTLTAASLVSTVYAVYGINKLLNGLSNHIYDPSTRHLREAVVDTLFNFSDLVLKLFTAYAFVGFTLSGSGLFTPDLIEMTQAHLGVLKAAYLTGLPLLFTHVHHFLLEGKARPVSKFLTAPTNNILIAASFALLQLTLDSPLLLVMGSTFYLSVSLFMALDVVHTLLMMLHKHNNPTLTLKKTELINTCMLRHVLWEGVLIVSHALSMAAWTSIGFLSCQYLLQSLPALLGFTLPSALSGLVSPLLSSLGTTPIYLAATATFICEGLRLLFNHRSHYNHNYLDQLHLTRQQKDRVVPIEQFLSPNRLFAVPKANMSNTPDNALSGRYSA
jgi:hypothetical protein